ncbi:MAG: hypothetical protein Q7S02_01830 [bacterium]|nr:hypothetical protein [bacterium]
MKPVLLATTAMVLYAIQNVVIEQKLSRLPVATLLVLFYAIMLPLALTRYGIHRAAGDATMLPTGPVLALTLVVGVVLFLADYCYLAAYTSGGTLMSVTTIAIMLPIFASIVKFAWARELPNGFQIAGYALAIVGKGNR